MRPITDVLRDVRKGAAVNEATEALADAVRAVDATGKAASVTIKITVKPSVARDAEKRIAVAIAASLPRADIDEALFFSDEHGDLLRTDPRQEELRFAEAQKRGA